MTATAYTALDLWQHIYGDPPADTTLYLCAFAARRATPETKELDVERQAFYAWPAEAADAAAWLAEQAADGCETYQAAHLTTRWRRQKADTADVLTLWCDVDTGTIPDHCQPTALVESSPGRTQAYLRLTRRIPWQQAESLNRRLAQLYGGDNGWHATKLLRVVGTPNGKYEGRPIVRVLHIRDTAYDPDDLDRILPPLKGTSSAAPDTATGDADEPWLAGMDRDLWQGKRPAYKDGAIDNSGTLWHIACDANELGASVDLIAMIFENRDRALGINKYVDRPQMYRQQAAKVADPNRERRPNDPTVVFGSREEDSPCSDQVAALQARIDQLEAENAELRDRFRAVLKLDRNPAIKAERTTVKAVAWELQSAYQGGRADADGWVKTWNGGIAENAGISPDRVGVHTTTMARDGLIEKQVRKEPVTKVDPETGEVTTVVLPRVYLRCTSVTDLLDKAAAWTPSPAPSKPKSSWGGAREAGADTCQHATTQTVCLDCGATLEREPQDAGHDPDHIAPAVPGAASTLHQQDAGHDRRRVKDPPDGFRECVLCHRIGRAEVCESCERATGQTDLFAEAAR